MTTQNIIMLIYPWFLADGFQVVKSLKKKKDEILSFSGCVKICTRNSLQVYKLVQSTKPEQFVMLSKHLKKMYYKPKQL